MSRSALKRCGRLHREAAAHVRHAVCPPAARRKRVAARALLAKRTPHVSTARPEGRGHEGKNALVQAAESL